MPPSRKILIAGDANLRASLAEQFALHPEFTLLQADAAARALEIAAGEKPELLLIDDDLPAPGARAFIASARSAGFAGCVILLASRAPDDAPDIDQCVIRPFRFAGLLARIGALLREREAARAGAFVIGPYTFHAGCNDLLHTDGTTLRLTEKEAAILARLARAGAAGASRDMLLRDVWGYNPAITTRTLETHIHRLRRKIEPDPARPRLLVTDAGGYRLMTQSAACLAAGD